MRWTHSFYQRNPEDDNRSCYYFSQRKALAILESVQEIKKDYYKVKVVAIESDEDFKVMTQSGGCTHQYYIGEVFTLRKHKDKRQYSSLSKFWYDPRISNKPYGENFELIEEQKNFD